MRVPAFAVVPLLLACLLAGCGKADTEPGPGGVSVGEAKALDEAAEMVEARQVAPPASPAPAQAPSATQGSATQAPATQR